VPSKASLPQPAGLDAIVRDGHAKRMSAVQQLRAATAANHDAVDAAFAEVDFADPESYGRFLMAHARALLAVEQALVSIDGLPPLRPRAALIMDDLRALGLAPPMPLPFLLSGRTSSAFGAAYVLEGSRLGGGMLAKRVGAGMPIAYLSATHLSGEWRQFLAMLDRSAADGAWIVEAIAAARATFDLYGSAAGSL
jgi:heme oxygenase